MSKRELKHTPATRLSHKLSSILRHGNDDFKQILIDNSGWVDIDYLLKKSNFCIKNNVTRSSIESVVKACPKQRFKIEDNKIRATQGHSIPVGDSELEIMTLEKAKTYDFVVHGTYYKSIGVILQSGLNKMSREHIHLTASDKVDGVDVISGFRTSCQVLIYIDIVKAIEAEYKFFVSPNNVVLCAGDKDGCLPVEYFLKVLDRKSGKNLLKSTNGVVDENTSKSRKSKGLQSTKLEQTSPQNSIKSMQNRAKNLKKKINKIKGLKTSEQRNTPSIEQTEMVKNLPQFEKEFAEINLILKT